MVEAVLEKIVAEQLINTMPANMRVWMSERKPKTADEVTDDYVQARRRDLGVKGTMLEEWRKEKVMDARRCHACGKEGHAHC